MTKTSDSPKGLWPKLAEIQRSLRGLLPDASAVSYKYVSGAKLLGVLRPKMDELGVMLKQEVTSIHNERQDYATRNGNKSEIFTTVDMRFTWVDTESGETSECVFSANGMNNWDKGLGSALTYGERYFLLKFFHIPTDEDDVDAITRDEAETPKQAKQAPKRVIVRPGDQNYMNIVKRVQSGDNDVIKRATGAGWEFDPTALDMLNSLIAESKKK